MEMFEIKESGFDMEQGCYFAIVTMFDGEPCLVRFNAFEPQNFRIEHQSMSLDQATVLEIGNKVVKEVCRRHINKGGTNA